MENQQETQKDQGQEIVPIVTFELCESCHKNDVCEVLNSALRLKQALDGITKQYQVKLSGSDIQVISCNHGIWNNGQEVTA